MGQRLWGLSHSLRASAVTLLLPTVEDSPPEKRGSIFKEHFSQLCFCCTLGPPELLPHPVFTAAISALFPPSRHLSQLRPPRAGLFVTRCVKFLEGSQPLSLDGASWWGRAHRRGQGTTAGFSFLLRIA